MLTISNNKNAEFVISVDMLLCCYYCFNLFCFPLFFFVCVIVFFIIIIIIIFDQLSVTVGKEK